MYLLKIYKNSRRRLCLSKHQNQYTNNFSLVKSPYTALIPYCSKMLYHKNHNSLVKNTAQICIQFCSKLQILHTLATNFKIYSCLQSFFSHIQHEKNLFPSKENYLLFSNLKTYNKSVQTSGLAFLTLNIKCQFPNVDTSLSFQITG